MRKLLTALLAAALLLAGAGCAKEEPATGQPQASTQESSGNETAAPAQKEDQDTVYYNSFLGLTVTAPAGFYVTNLNEANLSQDPAATANPNDLEWHDYGDGSFSLDLIAIANKRSDTHDDHAILQLYAEDYADFSGGFDAYWEDFLYYTDYTGEDGFYYVSEDTATAELHGRTYRTLTRVVGNNGYSSEYVEEYYVTQMGDIYVVVYVDYWSDSAQAKADAYFLREKCIKFIAAGAQAA
jgi:hypothetical protein